MICSKCGKEAPRYRPDSAKCWPCLKAQKKVYDSQRVWTSEMRKKRRARSWRFKMKHAFGLSPEDYRARLEAQDFRCAICRRHQADLPRMLAVDHDHSTGAIRGLLCNPCNTALGAFGDNLSHEMAVQYMKGSQ